MKLIKKVHEYKNQNGETKKGTQFYLVVEGLNNPIAIDPHTFGKKGSTYNVLNWLAEYVK